MLNRYSTWQDTLHVIPTGPESCIVHIDYFVKKDKVRLRVRSHCVRKLLAV